MLKYSIRSKTLIQSLLAVSLLSGSALAAAAPMNGNGWWWSLNAAGFSATTPAGVDSTWTGQQVVRSHYAPQSTNTAMTGLVGYGYQYGILENFFTALRIGAQYQYQSAITIKGNVADSQVGAYSYQNKVSSHVLWLDAQADLVKLGHFTPYVEAGIGAALNTFSNYSETYAAGTTSTDTNIYGNKNTLHGAYKVGVGVNYPITVKKGTLAIGIFYNYVDLGRFTSTTAALPGSPQLSENISGNQYGLALRYNI